MDVSVGGTERNPKPEPGLGDPTVERIGGRRERRLRLPGAGQIQVKG
jgi:hypothetical protein